VADLGEGDMGPAPPTPILGKEDSKKKERPVGQEKKKKNRAPLSSRSGSATVNNYCQKLSLI